MGLSVFVSWILDEWVKRGTIHPWKLPFSSGSMSFVIDMKVSPSGLPLLKVELSMLACLI
jgi:hypothetical protein